MGHAPQAWPGALTRRAALGALAWAALGAAGSPARPAHAQALLDGLRGSLDATEEGLRPGSPDDQSAALSAALREAEAHGQALFLPPGRYEIAGVDLPAHAHLAGVPGATILAFRGGPAMLSARRARFLRLTGVTLDGGHRALGAAGGLFDADGVDDLVIDDCAVLRSAGGGLQVRDAVGRIERTRVEDVATVGLHALDSRGLAIRDNSIAGAGDTGILVRREEAGEDGTIVTGNRVAGTRARSGGTGQYGNAINVAQANGVIVSGNRVDDSDFSAIRCFSSDNVQVSQNTVTRSGEMAIYVEFAFEGAVVANNIVDDAAFGISFANLLDYGGRLAVCSGNLVRNISGVSRLPRGGDLIGAGIGAEADIAITGNTIENAPLGMLLGWGPYLRDLAATANVIRGSPVGIGVSVVDGAGPALIADNLIAGAARGAILGMRWTEFVTGDLARQGAEQWPHLTVTGNHAG